MHPLIDPKKIVVGSVVGINYSGMHDTSVAIVSPSGKPIFAVSLERLTRTKQDGRWPTPLLSEIPWEKISKAAISVSETYVPAEHNYISKFHPTPLNKPNDADRSHGANFWKFIDEIPCERIFVPHHLSHAASSFWLSGYRNATCFVYDGGMSNEAWFGGIYQASTSDGINAIEQFSAAHSANITILYTAVTVLLGFSPLKHEGKITGLAAYGQFNKKCSKVLAEWLTQPELLDELLYWDAMYDKHALPTLNVNPLKRDELRRKIQEFSREDIAATVQIMAEKHVLDILVNVRNDGMLGENICLSGGLFANVKINQRISKFGFDNIFVSPPMSDDGTALGAAYHVVSNFSSFTPHGPVQHMYMGPRPCTADTLKHVHNLDISISDATAKEIASKLAAGLTVCVFRDACEFGPRALGNRSIIAPAIDVDINQALNSRLNRTEFMPFAPIMLMEDAHQYLEISKGELLASQFMTITVDCTEKAKRECPAIVHVDGTARPQLLTKDTNPLLYNVISEYKNITGKLALVNTSFNVHEEPIVCSIEDALRGFFESGLDCLYIDGIGMIELSKNGQTQLDFLKDKIKSLQNTISKAKEYSNLQRIELHRVHKDFAKIHELYTDQLDRVSHLKENYEAQRIKFDALELQNLEALTKLTEVRISAFAMVERLVNLLHDRNIEWAERMLNAPVPENTSEANNEVAPVNPTLRNLTPWARQIFTDLKSSLQFSKEHS